MNVNFALLPTGCTSISSSQHSPDLDYDILSWTSHNNTVPSAIRCKSDIRCNTLQLPSMSVGPRKIKLTNALTFCFTIDFVSKKKEKYSHSFHRNNTNSCSKWLLASLDPVRSILYAGRVYVCCKLPHQEK